MGSHGYVLWMQAYRRIPLLAFGSRLDAEHGFRAKTTGPAMTVQQVMHRLEQRIFPRQHRRLGPSHVVGAQNLVLLRDLIQFLGGPGRQVFSIGGLESLAQPGQQVGRFVTWDKLNFPSRERSKVSTSNPPPRTQHSGKFRQDFAVVISVFQDGDAGDPTSRLESGIGSFCSIA